MARPQWDTPVVSSGSKLEAVLSDFCLHLLYAYIAPVGLWSSVGRVSKITRASQSDTLRVSPWLKSNYRLWESFFFKNKKIWQLGKVWPFTRVRVSGFSSHQKLIQLMSKKLWASNFNYVSIQNGTTFYLLDLVDYSLTVGLNFGGVMFKLA
jgi:hypothetical protein